MNTLNGYSAIFFDLDGTLRHSVPLGADVFTDHVISLGFSVTSETRHKTGRWEHYYWANSPELQAHRQTFQDDEEAFWENYVAMRLKELGATPDQIDELSSSVRAHMRNEYQPVDWTPPELHTLLPELRNAGYTLAVLSNRRSPYGEVLDELALTQYFDSVMRAGEFGYWKPDPRIFEHALQRVNMTAEETIYIGDNYYADVVGARNANLQPVLYDPRGIFPEADCPRITSFTELPKLLEVGKWHGLGT